jgi:hypothetical protein
LDEILSVIEETERLLSRGGPRQKEPSDIVKEEGQV